MVFPPPRGGFFYARYQAFNVGTTAHIAGKRRAYFIVGRAGIFLKQRVGNEDFTRVAESAHGNAGLIECGNNVVVFVSLAEVFQCDDGIVFYLKYRNKTGGNRLIVHEHHTGSAAAGKTAFTGRKQFKPPAQNLYEPFSGIRIDIYKVTVEYKGYYHDSSSRSTVSSYKSSGRTGNAVTPVRSI